jgi:hypothetical protein
VYYVYKIGSSNELSQCYIGVTNDLLRRWKSHVKSGYSVSKDNSWTFENNMEILFEGSAEECFDLEAKFRPFPNMGLNEAKGGCGGHTKYSIERSNKLSEKLKGRQVTWGSKISETKKSTGVAKGSKNSKAKHWKLVDPNGNSYELHGTFFEFCNENNLSSKTLYNNVGKTIGPISPKFRDKGDLNIRQRRINTTGWTLYKGD